MSHSEQIWRDLYLQTLDDHARTVGELGAMSPVVIAIALVAVRMWVDILA